MEVFCRRIFRLMQLMQLNRVTLIAHRQRRKHRLHSLSLFPLNSASLFSGSVLQWFDFVEEDLNGCDAYERTTGSR